MDHHFRAFSFVDRITSSQLGQRILGQYTIPTKITAFSNSLVAEATGQLAAWAAMSALGFSHRPVAGLAGRVELCSTAHPGQKLDLTAEIESVDEEAVAYCGTAQTNGTPVVQLHHCVGPMMPLEDFDDPAQVQQRFNLLQTEGATPGAFTGVPQNDLEATSLNADGSMCATFQVPENGAFFADHFPRRPVFPGTLLTHTNLQLAVDFMERIVPASAGSKWIPRVISDVKLRSFIGPGETLELSARMRETTAANSTVAIQIHNTGKRIGSCRVDLTLEVAP